ncbi:polysaccharide deacetylase [Niabella ginsenosidivorans]|uniref:Polysaccharide deacetylase n=1 Tax=Niabella ginsenosidivorans TaxID=1176587 RepID=A0A1A9I372_9BACT|nr:polysaccharide deacetylase family protein [Niabella ginsenosidivorans]ANH82066.1 polysaccharide deacetylase [Niabella ginsenosidivorans]
MKDVFKKEEPPSSKLKWLTPCIFALVLLWACNPYNNTNTSRPDTGADSTNAPDTIAKTEDTVTAPPSNKKKVYLTFDDGPNLGTKNLLTILKDENVPATMFLIGLHTDASPEQKLMWNKMQAFPGIELCNHSYSHAWRNKFTPFYTHADSVISDFNRAQALMALKAPIARTPGRNAWRIDSITRTDLLKNKRVIDTLQSKGGFVLIGWDLEWQFNHKNAKAVQTADQLYNQVNNLFASKKTMVPDNLVILAHDQMWRTADDSLRLVEFIRKLKSNPDYELALINDYPGVKHALSRHKHF